MGDAAVGLEVEFHVQKELGRLRLSLLAGRVEQLMVDRHQQLAHRFAAINHVLEMRSCVDNNQQQ